MTFFKPKTKQDKREAWTIFKMWLGVGLMISGIVASCVIYFMHDGLNHVFTTMEKIKWFWPSYLLSGLGYGFLRYALRK